MTGIFQWYLDYIELINVVIIFLSLGFAGIFQMVRKGNKKRILNRKTIILDTIILNRIFVFAFLIVIITAGLASVAGPYKNGDGDLVSTVVGVIMILSSIGCLIYYCLKIRYLLKVNYTISSDTLVEKHSEIHGTRTNKHMYHYFQFNEYFKTNYKDIKVPYYIYKKANSGDKFYLVSSENLKRPFVFDANKYFLEDETVFQDDFMI